MENAAVANQARVTAPSAQDSGDTDDDLGLGDTEGSETLEDFPLTPYAEITESFSILEAAAEKSGITSYLFPSKGEDGVYCGRQQQEGETERYS